MADTLSSQDGTSWNALPASSAGATGGDTQAASGGGDATQPDMPGYTINSYWDARSGKVMYGLRWEGSTYTFQTDDMSKIKDGIADRMTNWSKQTGGTFTAADAQQSMVKAFANAGQTYDPKTGDVAYTDHRGNNVQVRGSDGHLNVSSGGDGFNAPSSSGWQSPADIKASAPSGDMRQASRGFSGGSSSSSTSTSTGGGGGGSGGGAPSGSTNPFQPTDSSPDNSGTYPGGINDPNKGLPTPDQGGGDFTATLDPNAGAPPMDFNAPMGLDFAGARARTPATNPQTEPFNSRTFPGPGSLTQGLDRNSTANDALLNLVRKQERGRDQALGIYGGLYDTYMDDSVRGSMRGMADQLGANPFSLDDQTVSRILGSQADMIGSSAGRMEQLSRDRMAAQGGLGSGQAQDQQDRIDINAGRQLGDAQRGLLVEQATRRPQELQSAMGATANVLQQDQSARERMGAGAANMLANQDMTADSLLMGAASGSMPTINIGTSGQNSGPIGSASYAGDARYNPFGNYPSRPA